MSTQGRSSVLTGGRFRPDPELGAAAGKAPEGAAAVAMVCLSLLEIQRLREENETLRQSAYSFGALAERLEQALQRERDARVRHENGS